MVAMIEGDSVMNGSPREAIIPWWSAVLEICSSITSQVDTLPPQINMQLVRLKRPASIAASADQRPRGIVAQPKVSGRGGRWRSDVGTFRVKLSSVCEVRLDPKPQRSLSPRTRRQRGAIENCSPQLQQRAKIAIGYGRERQDQAAIVGAVVRSKTACRIYKGAQEIKRGFCALGNCAGQRSMLNPGKPQRPQQQLQDQALVVEGMLL